MANKATMDELQRATGITYSDEQAKLISHDKGACVLACAGSGKTTAMTHMIARRLMDRTVSSGRKILGVTFSKTGANEMDERLEALIELLDLSTQVKMKTLHAFCLEFLKDINQMRGRAVLDEWEKLAILQELGRKNTKGWKYEDAEKIAGLITLQRGSMKKREDFISSIDFRSADCESLKYVQVYDAFKKYKADMNLIDFDDMLLLAHYHLGSTYFYGEQFMQRYECVMVDEAQDMSTLQFKIVFQLLGKDIAKDKNNPTPDELHEHEQHVKDTLVLIGDDDQCQPAGTMVLMGDGSEKSIEELEVGDCVLSYDLSADAYCNSTVSGIGVHTVDRLIKARCANGLESRYSPEHICLVLMADELVKLKAKDLREGMHICLPCPMDIKNGVTEYVSMITSIAGLENIEGSCEVYGLNIEGTHTYVSDGLLTANCIYEWLGSRPQGLDDARLAYNLPLFTLSTNYRCPENVLLPAARCISHNSHSIPKSMNAHKTGGTLSFKRVKGGFAYESKHIADDIKAQLELGVPPSSIAVLARNGAHLSLVWLYLSVYGIKSRVYGGGNTGPDTLIKHICGCFKLLHNPSNAGSVLYALLGGNRRASDKLADLISMVDGTFSEWIEYIMATFVPALGIKLSDGNSYADAGKAWKEAMREYYFSGGLSGDATMNALQKLYKASLQSPREFYIAVLQIYRQMMEWKYKSDDSVRIFTGTIKAMAQMLTDDPDAAIALFDSLDKHKAPNKNFITLSTAHSAKGREWSTVYILCDDVYAFPSQVSIDLLHQAGEHAAAANLIEAERRLHYVAMTRAKDTLNIIGGEVEPGRFLVEAIDSSIKNDTELNLKLG